MSTVPVEQASGMVLPARVEVAPYMTGSAIWAPSVHNTQPWWFVFDDACASMELHADTSRQLHVADPSGREMLISCGGALFTAKLALRTLGFGPAPLPPGLLGALRRGAARDGAALRVASDDASREVLAATVEMGERAQRLDSAYVAELAEWTPPPGSVRADGVSPSSYPARPERISPLFLGRDFARGHGWGLPSPGPAGLTRYAGVACVLTTPADRPTDWINAGHALQRILLTAAAYGAAAAIHSAPTEITWVRESVRTHIGDGSYPQLVLRLGTVIQTAVSLRRPVTSVLYADPDVGRVTQ